jgi:hypothetical protein
VLSHTLISSGGQDRTDEDFVATGTNQSPLVQVTIHYRVPLFVPIVEQVLPDPFPLKAQSGMRGE